jgi:large exoprotein involved in heme utilization and adhesion
MTIRRRHRQGARRGKDCSGGYRLLCAVLASIQILLPTLVAALPTEGHVVAGQATIQKVSPTTLSIAQASDKAILNWNNFSIATNEAVHFIQPSVSSIA